MGHELVVLGVLISTSEKKNAYVMDFFNQFDTSIYDPVSYASRNISSTAFHGQRHGRSRQAGRHPLAS